MKKRLWKIPATIYFAFFITVLCTVTASAYIDPATTAMLTQIIAGIAITLGVTFGIFRRKIFMFFKNLSVKRTANKIQRDNEKGK